MVQLLAAKANDGVRIRMVLGDPDSPEVAQRGEDEGIGESAVASRICNAQVLLEPLVAHEDVEIRLHQTVLYNSIFRADDALLATPHIYSFPGSAAPVLHLRHSADAALFATYLESFDRTWHAAGTRNFG